MEVSGAADDDPDHRNRSVKKVRKFGAMNGDCSTEVVMEERSPSAELRKEAVVPQFNKSFSPATFKEKLMGKEVLINPLFDIDFMNDELEGEEDEVLQEISDSGECPRVDFSEQERRSLWEPWRRSLIVKLLGKSMSYGFIATKLKQKWAIDGDLQLIDLGNDFYVAKFNNDEDLQHVLTEGPWVIAGHYLAIQRWKPEFRASTEKVTSTAAWIRLPELPVEYFEKDILTKIGNAVGRVLKIDRTTAQASRGRFARLCVEIDLSKPLASKVLVRSRWWQKVEYEGLQLICFECGRYGHRRECCPDIPTDTYSEKADDQLSEKVAEVSEEPQFGPWMLAQQRGKRPMMKPVTKPAIIPAIKPVVRPGLDETQKEEIVNKISSLRKKLDDLYKKSEEEEDGASGSRFNILSSLGEGDEEREADGHHVEGQKEKVFFKAQPKVAKGVAGSKAENGKCKGLGSSTGAKVNQRKTVEKGQSGKLKASMSNFSSSLNKPFASVARFVPSSRAPPPPSAPFISSSSLVSASSLDPGDGGAGLDNSEDIREIVVDILKDKSNQMILDTVDGYDVQNRDPNVMEDLSSMQVVS